LVTGKSIGPFVAAVFAVSLPGCVYVPPVWDINDEINTVSNMKEGVATREDVLDRLGEPNGNIEAHTFTYSGKETDWANQMGISRRTRSRTPVKKAQAS
jgi:hypothetical protein